MHSVFLTIYSLKMYFALRENESEIIIKNYNNNNNSNNNNNNKRNAKQNSKTSCKAEVAFN